MEHMMGSSPQAIGKARHARVAGVAVAILLVATLAACNPIGPTVGVGAPGSSTTTTSSTPTTSTTSTSTTSTTTTTTTVDSTTTTTAPSPSCGGQQTLVSDGTTWQCTFDSEFTGTTLDPSQWVPMVTANDGYTSGDTACFENSPNNISVGNGYLTLTAREEAAPFVCTDPLGNFTTQYTSGSVQTDGLFSQTYGRVEVMAKVPAATVAGLQSSFWLYPLSGDSTTLNPAELDIAETYTSQPGVAIPYIHYDPDVTTENTATNTNVVTNTNCAINVNQFNDYVIEWSSTTVTMIYNGTTCLVDHYDEMGQPQGTPFNQPFFINLTQCLGIDSNQFNPETTPLPATTEIEYVRAWQAES
jgi:beta-glucanase (GH16 family)